MSPEGAFLATGGCVFGSAGGIALIVWQSDRIVVAVLRWSGLPVYPLAVSIAVLIYEHPEQWSGTEYRLSHPKIGAIWVANQTYGIHVESEFGRWKPNWIERRIIRDAVDWRIRRYIQNRITQAMKALPP